MPGVEKIAWMEIKDKLPGVKFGEFHFAKGQNGIVSFAYAGQAGDLLALRTTEDVFVEALTIKKMSRDWRDLRLIADKVADTAVFQQAVEVAKRTRPKERGPLTYRIISRQYGQHQYRRKDLAEAVAKGVQRRYPRWRPVADHAQLEIWVNLLGSYLLCGIRLSDRTMRHRFEHKRELAASLRPSVAAAIVYLTQPDPADIFLDPMCGSGTILMERRLAGPVRQMVAADIGRQQVQATRHNVGRQKRTQPAFFTVLRADGQHLPLAAQSMTKIASNLPFGKQIGSPKMIARLYPAFFTECDRVLKPNGRAVVLSSEFDLVKTAVRQCPGLNIVTGYSVATLGQWGRIYIIQRPA